MHPYFGLHFEKETKKGSRKQRKWLGKIA